MPEHSQQTADDNPDSAVDDQRRGFLTRLAALAAGGFVALFPPAAGLVAFFDPVRRKTGDGGFIRVATLDALSGNQPQFFQVVADKDDAWNHYPKEPLGGIYLRRSGTRGVECLSATCPHLGCLVDFLADKNVFKCPCHNSSFQPDGARIDPKHCPSPRDLDKLEIDEQRLQAGGEIFVRYQTFRPGVAEKVSDE